MLHFAGVRVRGTVRLKCNYLNEGIHIHRYLWVRVRVTVRLHLTGVNAVVDCFELFKA